VVALAARDPMEFAPGTQSGYNNVGYTVLGLLIEKVAEEPYRNYLASSIFKPHGLNATRSCDTDDLIPHRAAGYVQRDTGVVNAPHAGVGIYFAAGALCSTVGDLARWHQALGSGRVIGAASLARMTTLEGAAVSSNYGYGVIAMRFEGHRLIGHGGEVMGFRSATSYLPDDSLSVTVLTNMSSTSPAELHLDIVRAALAQPRTRRRSIPGDSVR
jgi:CubicO group peptidase (beta-lactamase class C family)